AKVARNGLQWRGVCQFANDGTGRLWSSILRINFRGREAMSSGKRFAVCSAFLLAMGFVGARQTIQAQTLDEKALKGMKWRQIGPFRGGRALAVAGVAGDRETDYFGAVAGGGWKAENGGMTGARMPDK